MEIFISRDGKRAGPFTREQFKALVASGRLQPTDLVWHTGLGNWSRFQDLADPSLVTSQPKVQSPDPSRSAHASIPQDRQERGGGAVETPKDPPTKQSHAVSQPLSGMKQTGIDLGVPRPSIIPRLMIGLVVAAALIASLIVALRSAISTSSIGSDRGATAPDESAMAGGESHSMKDSRAEAIRAARMWLAKSDLEHLLETFEADQQQKSEIDHTLSYRRGGFRAEKISDNPLKYHVEYLNTSTSSKFVVDWTVDFQVRRAYANPSAFGYDTKGVSFGETAADDEDGEQSTDSDVLRMRELEDDLSRRITKERGRLSGIVSDMKGPEVRETRVYRYRDGGFIVGTGIVDFYEVVPSEYRGEISIRYEKRTAYEVWSYDPDAGESRRWKRVDEGYSANGMSSALDRYVRKTRSASERESHDASLAVSEGMAGQSSSSSRAVESTGAGSLSESESSLSELIGSILGDGSKQGGDARGTRSSSRNGRDKENVMRGVRQYLGSLRYQYNKRLREKPGLSGKVNVKFTISGAGSGVSCQVVSSTMDDPVFEQVVASKVKEWKFEGIDDLGDLTEVVYPFNFTN